MRCFSAILLACFGSGLSFAADERLTDFDTLSDSQIAAGSISALLRSGKARFVSEEPEEIDRLEKILSERDRVHRLETKLHSMQASFVASFDRRQGAMIRKRTVSLLLDEDTQVGQGVLIEAERAWVVAPLDIAREYEGRLFLRFDDGTLYKKKHEVLSSVDNLALFRVPSHSLVASGFVAAPEVDSLIEAGTLVAASRGAGELIVGGISAIEPSFRRWHRKPVRKQIDAHLASFGVAPDDSQVSPGKVILCDLDIQGAQRGAPVFSLQGAFVGLAVSRIDLSETALVPSETIRRLLLLRDGNSASH